MSDKSGFNVLRFRDVAVYVTESLCIFEKSFPRKPPLKNEIFKVSRFHTACAPGKACSEKPRTSSDNPTTASENKAQKIFKKPCRHALQRHRRFGGKTPAETAEPRAFDEAQTQRSGHQRTKAQFKRDARSAGIHLCLRPYYKLPMKVL